MKNRVVYYDVLRVLSIFAVITMHVIGNTLNTLNLHGVAANIYGGICQLMYFAVPIFVMISGTLFLNPKKQFSIEKLYKKYILRIVVCLFGFGFFYSMLELYFNTRVINLNMIIQSIVNIFTGNLWDHMWYLYLIIGLYIITPLLKKVINNCTQNEYKYLLIILFIFTILIPDISKCFNINIAFNILVSNPYIFFFILGDYLSRYEVSKHFKFLNYGVSIIFIILIFINNFTEIFDMKFVTYTSFLMSNIIITIFLFTKNLKLNLNNKGRNILANIGECGFGIYLIHQLIINILFKLLKLDFILYYPYLGLIIYIAIIFIVSYTIIYFLRKINFIRNYIL